MIAEYQLFRMWMTYPWFQLMDISPDRPAEFYSLAQANYVKFFQAGDTTPRAMLMALQKVMARHWVFADAAQRR